MWPGTRNLPRAPDTRYRISEFNSYLAHLKAPFFLSLPQPSNCEIASAFKFLLEHLDYPISEKGFEEDLLSFLPIVGCYININKSDLSEPSAPHILLKILDVLEWLAEFARESDRLSECQPSSSTSDDFLQYVTQIYLSRDDDAREEHKQRYASLVRARSDILAEQAEEMEKIIADLEAKLAARKSGPSFREELEKKKGLLIEDKKKFEAVAESWRRKHREMMERGNGLGKVLEVNNKVYKRLSEEKTELEKRIALQRVSVRDMERMKCEIQVLDREIEEANNAKSVAEEKVWEAEAVIAQKLDEFESVVEQYNLAVKKFSEKKRKREEESIALQKQFQDICKVCEEKKKLLTALQDKLDEIDGCLRLVKNEVEEHRATCAAETKKMTDYLAEEENRLSTVENEARENLKSAETKLRDVIRVAEEDTQRCASMVIAVMDAAKEFKKSMESMVDTNAELAERIDSVVDEERNLNLSPESSDRKQLLKALHLLLLALQSEHSTNEDLLAD